MFIDDTTKEIMGKERSHRTRATVLQSTGKVGSDTTTSLCYINPSMILSSLMLTPTQKYSVVNNFCNWSMGM